MAKLKKKLPPNEWQMYHLVLAGGYDSRLEENVSYHIELKNLAIELEICDQVSFLRSISNNEKVGLLKRAYALIYTPTNEHFGIVPIEAMYCEVPVLATNTGGPLETIVNGVTGFLLEPNADSFSAKMKELAQSVQKRNEMASQARKRVIEHFSFIAFKQQLNNLFLMFDRRNSDVKNDDKTD
jgi:alpha-1,3/alpha-1,6-mannosyltransferase